MGVVDPHVGSNSLKPTGGSSTLIPMWDVIASNQASEIRTLALKPLSEVRLVVLSNRNPSGWAETRPCSHIITPHKQPRGTTLTSSCMRALALTSHFRGGPPRACSTPGGGSGSRSTSRLQIWIRPSQDWTATLSSVTGKARRSIASGEAPSFEPYINHTHHSS